MRVDRRVGLAKALGRLAARPARKAGSQEPSLLPRPHELAPRRPRGCGSSASAASSHWASSACAQRQGELRQAPVLVGVFQRHRRAVLVPALAFDSFRHVAALDVVFHAAAAGIGAVLVAGMVADAAGQGVLAQALVGLLGVVVADALVVGRGEERRGRVADHHEGIIAARRAAGNQPAVVVHVHHRVAEGVHDLRIGKRPEEIQRPVAAPEGVEIVVREAGAGRRAPSGTRRTTGSGPVMSQ